MPENIILFQIVSFMQDLQGDPKGLSIGGLVVIDKATSLTVNQLEETKEFVIVSITVCRKPLLNPFAFAFNEKYVTQWKPILITYYAILRYCIVPVRTTLAIIKTPLFFLFCFLFRLLERSFRTLLLFCLFQSKGAAFTTKS